MLNKFKNGFSLIEILVVVGFITLAGIGAYVLYQKITENSLINKESTSMKRIFNDSHQIVSVSPGKLNLSATLLSQYGIIDKEFIVNGAYTNKLGTPIIFSSIYGNNQRITHLKVEYTHMSEEFCSRLINIYEPYTDFISVGMNVVKNHVNPDDNIDYDMNKAFDDCSKSAIPNNDFTMILFFKY